jgi:ABC-2 type transport system ATP-binding protein
MPELLQPENRVPMITIENLTKLYGQVKAVENLNLVIHTGEIFGLLGPNGAGKTTTIRILTTLTKPTSGHARVNGFDVMRDPLEVKRAIGVVQQNISLDQDLTVRENMEAYARLHHLGSSERKQRIAELLDYVGIENESHRIVSKLSGGMKRRLMIARALICRPRLLFLDEPTVGLDAQTRRRLWELIRRMNLNGTTVLLTTHYIEEAEALCGRVGIIHQGHLMALGSPLELRQRLGLVTVETLSNNKDTHYIYFPDRTAATSYAQNLPPDAKTIIVRESNLEDVFVELTGRKVGED